MSPTQRTLKKMRDEGYLCEVVERWNPYAKIRHDLFGFIDVLCVKGDLMVGVQSTSGSNSSARVEKIKSNPNHLVWLSPTRKLIVHAWRKVGERGKRKTWQCRETEITSSSSP